MYPCLRYNFQEIHDHLKQYGNTRETLELFYKKASINDTFDQNCVKFIRYPIYKFLRNNPRFRINGLSLKVAITTDSDSIDSYAENVVRKMGENALTVVLCIAPIVFRCNISTYVADSSVK